MIKFQKCSPKSSSNKESYALSFFGRVDHFLLFPPQKLIVFVFIPPWSRELVWLLYVVADIIQILCVGDRFARVVNKKSHMQTAFNSNKIRWTREKRREKMFQFSSFEFLVVIQSFFFKLQQKKTKAGWKKRTTTTCKRQRSQFFMTFVFLLIQNV